NTSVLGRMPRGRMTSRQVSSSRSTTSRLEHPAEKFTWLKEWVPISWGVLHSTIRWIRSGAYHDGALRTLEQGSCAHQSPHQLPALSGRGMLACARPVRERTQLSTNRR